MYNADPNCVYIWRLKPYDINQNKCAKLLFMVTFYFLRFIYCIIIVETVKKKTWKSYSFLHTKYLKFVASTFHIVTHASQPQKTVAFVNVR